ATHGDEKAQDGIFTANYQPNQTGSFKVRVRGQVDLVQDTKIVTKEFWSPFASFQVVAIPYPHVTSPEPGSKTSTKIKVRASLLQQGSPFDKQDETLKAYIVAKSKGQLIVKAPLKRKGSVLEGTLNLPKIGTYQLAVIVSVNRMGKDLTTESQAIEIQVTRPDLSFLIVAILTFIVYLILPIKQPSLRYRHRVRIGQTIIELNPGEEKTVNEISVKGAIDSNTVTIRTRQGKEILLREQQTESVNWWEKDQRKEVTIRYEKAEPLRAKPSFLSRLLPTTPLRLICLLVSLAALGWWLYTWQKLQ
ncbi:MAG: choice-of-anchor X domain-containing protein, partial [Armatimonadota bacterium]|nr:choice-of-anchor X domain-containing protein [Armatimonadota bacterium]